MMSSIVRARVKDNITAVQLADTASL